MSERMASHAWLEGDVCDHAKSRMTGWRIRERIASHAWLRGSTTICTAAYDWRVVNERMYSRVWLECGACEGGRV